MTARNAIALIAALIAPAVRLTARTPLPEAVEQLYGKEVRAAQATPGEADDLAVAKRILTASEETRRPPQLRIALARAALGLTVPLGSEVSARLAEDALSVLDGLQPLADAERATLARDIAARRLRRAMADRESTEKLIRCARAAAEAHLACADAALTRLSATGHAAASLRAARELVRKYRLAGLDEAARETGKAIQQAEARQARIERAKAALETARKAGNEASSQAARRTLARLYLEYDGDMVVAAQYIGGTKEPCRDAVLAAAAFLQDPNAPLPAACTQHAEELARLAKSFADPARRRIAATTLRMYQTHLATAGGSGEPRLVAELEKLSGQTPADKLLRKLSAAYGGLHCRIEIVDPERTRAIYDFAERKQLADWQAGKDWFIAKGSIASRLRAVQTLFVSPEIEKMVHGSS